jgi:hypothetical protein
MPIEKLPALAGHSFILIDANIFIYGLSGQSTQCRQFLDRRLREYALSFLASNDADFERVAGLTVFKPSDFP